MACSSCGKKGVKKVYTIPVKEIVTSNYVENQDGIIAFVYTGIQELRAKGCMSRHIYLFSPNHEYSIDRNDFFCFMERWPETFRKIENDFDSDYSKKESEPATDTTGISEGYEYFHDGSREGLPEDSKDVGQ